MRLKADVEKGSMWTAFGHGLVDPKTLGKSFGNFVILYYNINIIIIIIIIILLNNIIYYILYYIII